MSLDKLKIEGLKLLKDQHFDCLAVGILDFQNNDYSNFEITSKNIISDYPFMYFDLASLTKPLTNSAALLKNPQFFNDEIDLLLNHKAGLPSGGLLSKKTWRDEISKYEIKKSETLYSDYSSLRCMLELERASGKKLQSLCSYYFDPELVFWRNIPIGADSPEYGIRNKQIISGEVHDNNCFNIGEFVSHAGLFSTIGGLSRSLLNLNKEVNLINTLKEEFKVHNSEDRFIIGFDHVMDPENTLAGKGSTVTTFGHLGFTGTSFWINPEQNKGAIILTNATQSYWYERKGLTHLRKTLGELIWNY